MTKHLNLLNIHKASPIRPMKQKPITHLPLKTSEQFARAMKKARKVCERKIIYISGDPRRNMIPFRARMHE